jgi:hypothetical protein
MEKEMIEAKQLPKAFELTKDNIKMVLAKRKNGNYTATINNRGSVLFRVKNKTKEEIEALSATADTITELLKEIPSFLAHRDDI